MKRIVKKVEAKERSNLDVKYKRWRIARVRV